MSLIPMQSGNEAAKMIVRASYSSFALQVQDHCSISKNGSLCFKVSILTFPACLGNQDQSTILNFTYVCLHPRTHTAHTLTHTHCSHPHTHCSHTLLTPSHTLLTHTAHTLTHTAHTLTYTAHTLRHTAHNLTHTLRTPSYSHSDALTPITQLSQDPPGSKTAGLPGGEDQGVPEVLACGQVE